MSPHESLERVLLRQAVEADRAALEQALSQLHNAVRHELDPGRHIAPHRYGWLVGGFVMGFLWGLNRGRIV